jgi:hypothetical protein
MKLYMFRTVPLSETCRVSFQNKFEKLVHLVGFITRKYVTIHGHVEVKRGREGEREREREREQFNRSALQS